MFYEREESELRKIGVGVCVLRTEAISSIQVSYLKPTGLPPFNFKCSVILKKENYKRLKQKSHQVKLVAFSY